MMLPASTRASLDAALDGVSRRDLAERQARISERYRAGKGSNEAIRDALDALAYAVARMPATYAACHEVFRRAAIHMPVFTPLSLLDLGSGSGAATLAAREVWPSIASVRQVESNAHFRALATKLCQAGPVLDIVAGDATAPGSQVEAADLVVASYVLVEQSEEKATRLVEQAIRLTSAALVLVEPGTPAGFACLARQRSKLMASGLSLAAPCPGAIACPMHGRDWCHFSVRLERSRDHKFIKAADVPFEDERFAYLVAHHEATAIIPTTARILSEPEATRAGFSLKLCTPEGLADRAIDKRDKPAFKAARRSKWGDAV